MRIHNRDNLATVEGMSWHLHAHLFDGDVAAGPNPILFANDMAAANEALLADPGKAHFDLSKVFRHCIVGFLINSPSFTQSVILIH